MRIAFLILVVALTSCGSPVGREAEPSAAGDKTAASASSGASGAASSTGTKPEAPPTGTAPSSAPAGSATPVQILSWAQTEALVAKHAGKIVVLDVWSTYCSPCMRELPHLVELQASHADSVRCVSLSVDYIGTASKPPESYRERVEEFLDRIGARLDNVLCATPDDEVFGKLGIASIPCVVVFDRQGKIHKTFSNDDNEYGEAGFSYERQIVPLVNELSRAP